MDATTTAAAVAIIEKAKSRIALRMRVRSERRKAKRASAEIRNTSAAHGKNLGMLPVFCDCCQKDILQKNRPKTATFPVNGPTF